MKKANSIFIIMLLSAVVGCSSLANKNVPDSSVPDTSESNKSIQVSMTDHSGILKLDSIITGNENSKVTFEIAQGKKFMAFAPGTYNSFFFMDPISKKEYKLLSGEGIVFNADDYGPKKFILTFEKLDNEIKKIHLIGGKEALVAGIKTVGFYDIDLEK